VRSMIEPSIPNADDTRLCQRPTWPRNPVGGVRRNLKRAAGGPLRLTGVLLSATVAAACGTGSAGGNPANGARIFGTGLNQVQQEAIYTAEQTLIQRCMDAKGFQYLVAAATPPGAHGNTNPLATNTDSLRTNGYGIYQIVTTAPPKGQAGVSVDPNAKYLASLSSQRATQFGRALDGTKRQSFTLPDGKQISFAVGGCYGRADTELYGSSGRYQAMAQYDADLISKINTEAGFSKVWTSAEAAWARCMAVHHLRYATEAAAQLDIYNRYTAPGASISKVHQYEMRVAIQDADCSDATHMRTAGREAVQRATSAFTTDQVNAILAWNELERRALARGNRILAHV